MSQDSALSPSAPLQPSEHAREPGQSPAGSPPNVPSADPRPAPMPDSPADRLFALLTLVLGYGLIYVCSSSHFAVKMAAFTGVYVVFVLAWLALHGRRPAPESWFWLAILLSIGIPQMFWSLIGLLQVPALFFAAAYWTLCAAGGLCENGRTSAWLPLDLANCLCALPFGNFACQWTLLIRSARKNARGRAFLTLLLGLVLALPLLMIVLPLLSRADASFAELINRMLFYLFDHFAVFALRLVFAVPTACCIFGLIYGSIWKHGALRISGEDAAELLGQFRFLPGGAVCIALGLICACYVLFLALQGQYFFSAFAGIRPDGYTYAEYARQGFFELCQIAAINLLVLLPARGCSRTAPKDSRPLRFVSGLLIVLTLLLIATAASKLFLYIGAYGLTAKRILATTFLVWLAIVFFCLLIRQKRPGLPIVPICVWSGAVLFAQLCLLPWNAACSQPSIENMVSRVGDEYVTIVWDDRTYVPYCALADYGTRGEQIGILNGDPDDRVYALEGYAADEWIVNAFPHDGGMLFREIHVTGIPDGWQSEYSWNRLGSGN